MRAIIDPRLESNYPVDEYKQVIEIAIQCTTYDRNERPKMQVSIIHTYAFKHTHTLGHMNIHICTFRKMPKHSFGYMHVDIHMRLEICR